MLAMSEGENVAGTSRYSNNDRAGGDEEVGKVYQIESTEEGFIDSQKKTSKQWSRREEEDGEIGWDDDWE